LKTNNLAEFSFRDPLKQTTYKPPNGQKQPETSFSSQTQPETAILSPHKKTAVLPLPFSLFP
jgi:hypothetical protein